jgi:quercetin dioxygenase-like cupin family protein
MKRHLLLGLLLMSVVGGLWLLPAMSRVPQTVKSVEIKDESHHHLKFENEFVRVWETVLPAGEVTLWHRHNFDNVAVTITDAKLGMEALNRVGTVGESETKMGDVAFRSASYTHRALNLGSTLYDNLLVELLKTPGASQIPAKDDNGRKPVFENDRVRIYRISLAPGESVLMHTHPVAGLALTLRPAEIAIKTEGTDKIQELKVAQGEVRWRPGPVTHSVKNVGKTRFEAVDVELK